MFRNKTFVIILLFCLLRLILELIADYHSGFSNDEFLHIETGNHPAMGYMEFPPMIGWLAWIQNHFHSQSVFVHHIFAHIASLLILILVALCVTELGGKASGVFFALLSIVVSPGLEMSEQLFQPVVLSQFFWVLCFYQLLRFIKTVEHKYLLYLTLSLAFGFLAKYDIVFFIAGLSSMLFFQRTRSALASFTIGKYVILFIVLIAPNLWWQYQHNYPALHMFSRLYETQLDKLSAVNVLKEIIIALNPFVFILVLAGGTFMFRAEPKGLYRSLAVPIALSILLLAIAKSKSYYFFPAIITLIAFGSICLERLLVARTIWLTYIVTILFVLSGIVMLPWGISVLPLDAFIKVYGLKKDNDHYTLHFSEYYSRSKWKNTLTALSVVYDSLPEGEKSTCLIWGKHYSQAGAVDLYGRDYHLPGSFSYHGSFYLWAPSGQMPKTVIGYTNGEAGIDFFENYFDSVHVAKRVFNPYADFDKDLWQTIYICRGPKQSFNDMKIFFKYRIFE